VYYSQIAKDKRDKLSGVLLAIGDPTRREILKKVSQGELCVLERAPQLSSGPLSTSHTVAGVLKNNSTSDNF
jgi:DNA-binding transcriptional ArsR family regulator